MTVTRNRMGGGISLNVAHTLDSADRHGVMAAGFSFGQSEKARSLGYEEEKSPTLRGGEGGNQKPVVMACDLYNQSVDGETAASVTAAVGGVNTSGPKLLAFAQNQRDEVRDLNDLSGALAVDCRNGTESPDTNGTLQAKDSGGTSLNLNNVVRTSGGGNEPMGRTERENLRK